jgi:hypothetical protein
MNQQLPNIAVIAGLLAIAPVFAQVLPPPLTPSAPTSLSPQPPDTVVHAPNLVLRWRQGGLSATQPQPPNAQHFRICIYDTSIAGQSCSSPTVQWIYAAGAAEIHRTAVNSPFGQPIPGAYAYRFEPPSGTVPFDRWFVWQIGACTSQALTSCRYSVPGFLHLSTQNLTATDIAEQLTSKRIFAGGEVQNNGSTASGTFRTDLYINRALLDPSGVCATNLSSAVVLPTDYVRTATGRSVPVQAGNVPGAVGITRDGSLNWFAKAEGYASVGIGMSATTVSLEESLSGVTLPAAFLFTVAVNYPSVGDPTVTEYDRSDNVRVECHVVNP